MTREKILLKFPAGGSHWSEARGGPAPLAPAAQCGGIARGDTVVGVATGSEPVRGPPRGGGDRVVPCTSTRGSTFKD